jgi:hypothetical protein
MGQAARRARRALTCLTAGAAQALLQAGQLDELEIDLVPVCSAPVAADARAIELQLVRQLEGREVTHLRYQVRR